MPDLDRGRRQLVGRLRCRNPGRRTLAARTLVLTALTAPTLTYGTLPLATCALRGWLRPSTITSRRCADAAVHDPDPPAARAPTGPATST